MAAAEAFFLEPASPDYWLRIRRWEQAEEKVYDSFPEDPEEAAFYALAHLGLRPPRTHLPSARHALHMSTHIYTRLGDWDAVIRGNLRTAEATLKYPSGEHGEFVRDEFPHAIEYLVYAYLQKGADDRAAARLRRVRPARQDLGGLVLRLQAPPHH